MVFYRKYRPQNFSELIGQDAVTTALVAAIQKGTLGHAMLFSGPRGCGKTSTARIVAKALNCEKVLGSRLEVRDNKKNAQTSHLKPQTSSVDPCNQCPSCIAITQGSHIDVVEIDAASNRGIDDIRGLQERIGLAPALAKKKVYIIDEVHMLTTEAFNALLKTLEEPPSHAVLILATTEVQKIPQTILSRCQRFSFGLASHEALKQTLQRIAAEEKLTIDDEALNLLVQRAEGGYRDGVKLLDQIANMAAEIHAADVEALFHAPAAGLTVQFFEYLLEGNEHDALALVQTIYERGENMQSFSVSFLTLVRSLLLLKSNIITSGSQEDKNLMLAKLADGVSKHMLVSCLKRFAIAEREMRQTSLPMVPLELAVIEFLNQDSSDQPSVFSSQVESKDPQPAATPLKPIAKKTAEENAVPPLVEQAPIAPEEVGAMIAEASDNIVVATPQEVAQVVEQDAPQASKAINEEPDNSGAAVATGPLAERVARQWGSIVRVVKEQNHSVALLLRNASIKKVTDESITLEVFYKFHKERLENDKIRRFVEAILAENFGQSMRLVCVLSDKKPQRVESEEIDTIVTDVFGVEAYEVAED